VDVTGNVVYLSRDSLRAVGWPFSFVVSSSTFPVRDTTPPVLTQFKPNLVEDDLSSPKAVTAVFNATDDATGVSQVFFHYIPPSGVYFWYDGSIHPIASQVTFGMPTIRAGRVLAVSVTPPVSNGVHAPVVRLVDAVGNSHAYTSDQFKDLGISSTGKLLILNGLQDSVAPVCTEIVVSQTFADVSDVPASLAFHAACLDDNEIAMVSLFVRYAGSEFLLTTVGGFLSFPITLAARSQPGSVEVIGLVAQDRAGNIAMYGACSESYQRQLVKWGLNKIPQINVCSGALSFLFGFSHRVFGLALVLVFYL